MEFRPMSPEEIERTLQFLLSQQAQFAGDFARLSEKTDKMADALIGLTGVVGRVAEGLERLTDDVRRLADVQRRTDEQLRDTDARLDVVIQMFERHLREDHGHGPS